MLSGQKARRMIDRAVEDFESDTDICDAGEQAKHGRGPWEDGPEGEGTRKVSKQPDISSPLRSAATLRRSLSSVHVSQSP